MERTRVWPVAAMVVLILVVSALGAVGGLSALREHGAPAAPSISGPIPALTAFNAPLAASLTISPSQLHAGQSINVQTTASGGTPPYSYGYSGLPPGCGSSGVPSFSCNPSTTGTFNVNVAVSDSLGNHTTTNSISVDVTSSGSGNGNGNGNGSNSSNPLSSLLSGLGGYLSLVLIFGIIGFATWVLLVVGIWVIAIVLMRRLPKRGAAVPATPTVKCAACAAEIGAGSKFCPECGKGTASKSS